MELKGISIGFTDCDEEVARDFNRWYDTDHVPENIALPEIVTARRYVQTPDLVATRGAQALPEFQDGVGRYIATYLLGVDDFDTVERKMKGLFDDLLKVRRIFRRARVTYSDKFRLIKAYPGESVPVGPEAVPYLGHDAIMVALTDVPDHSRRAEVEQWWDEVHIPDMVAVPGMLGAMRLESVVPDRDRRVMFMFLVEGEPADLAPRMREHSQRWAEQGRVYKQDERPHRSLYNGYYRLITPFKYDFL